MGHYNVALILDHETPEGVENYVDATLHRYLDRVLDYWAPADGFRGEEPECWIAPLASPTPGGLFDRSSRRVDDLMTVGSDQDLVLPEIDVLITPNGTMLSRVAFDGMSEEDLRCWAHLTESQWRDIVSRTLLDHVDQVVVGVIIHV